MSKILVIGASGQLGSVVLNQLVNAGQDSIAFIRPSSRFSPPTANHLQVVHGDLTDLDSLNKACAGVNQVIATASSIIPRTGDKFAVNEVKHYQNLIFACQNNKIQHLIYISAFSSPYDKLIPEFMIKRQVEHIIVNSGIPYTIFRCAAFMDIYYAAMGSQIVMNGVSQPTLLRGFWLTKLYSKLTTGLLENQGISLLPGDGTARHSFICINDVAAFMVKAVTLPTVKNRTIELGGPEALSWSEVANTYANVLGKKVIKLRIPSVILNVCRQFFRHFSPAGENVMSILFLLGKYDFDINMTAISKEFDIHLTDTKQFILEKLKLQQ